MLQTNQSFQPPPERTLSDLAQTTAQGLPYLMDFKCEWDVPMWANLAACVSEEVGAGHGSELLPFATDQKYLQTMPDVGFFKKYK